jgi:serine/threonine-protein kinase
LASDLLAHLQEVLGNTYRVDRELGGAGMSRVFLAHEVDLERQVVIKVLPPDLAAGINADRFRREIQLAARLQHPHIVPLLSAAAKGGLLYYTMPFIAGENLRARLSRVRELPVGDATKILREVADALEYAHEQGVVHRDIKPENILFSGNHALVTDFGVSKALSSATSQTRVAGAPTLTSLGIALGTPTYMAPEQAAADPNVDHRADIYSLGVVGYELLAGRPPFTGMTQQQILAAQVSAVPDPVTQYRPNIPPALAAAIMRCLEKHPSDRWQTAAELRAQLEAVFTPSGATQPVPAARRPAFTLTPRRVMLAAAAAGVLVAGVFLSTIAFKKDEVGFTIGATHQITNLPGAEVYPAVSPDGKMVTYVQNLGGKGQIFLRQISGGRAVALTDSTVDAFWPRWKPDGSAILYTADGTVHTIPPLGGSATALLSKSATGEYAYCDWSPEGTTIICANLDDGALYRFDGDGGNLRRITPPSPDILHSVAWSPDGRRIAYVSGNIDFLAWQRLGNLAASSIWVMSADGGGPVRITDVSHLNTSPVWSPDGGHVLFVSNLGGARDIYSQAVRGSGEPRGSPVRFTTGLNPHTISVSADGRSLAYSAFTTTANIWGAPLHGADPIPPSSMHEITFGNQTIEQMSVSRDGRWLAYDSNLNGNADIYKVPVSGGEAQQLTRDPTDDFAPSWSPDGREIVFHSFRNGNRDIFVISADGSRTETVVATPSQELVGRWSPDGRSIAYFAYPDSVFVVSRTATGWGKPKFLTRGTIPEFSPDGTRIAFAVPTALVVMPANGGPQKQIYAGASGALDWSRDSRFIYYCNGLNAFLVIPSTGGPPKPLLRLLDPLRQLYRGKFAVDPNHIYFTIGSRESDIWVMELNRK